MGKALYRKYRSKSLSEIVGQEHITTTLHNALKAGKISHAYLFTGPRGTGKTSIARILAHEVNELPYSEEATHLDIIEIDAASNRRIDEIRELRERVHTAPSSAKYKVYIIDEVHMLTKEAFNALLKTLEEPPEHAIFILATTESHKLPETIISRTQHFTFKPIDQQKVINHLRSIAKAENIDITDDALQLIAEHGGGAFRDSISLLDQTRNIGEKIDVDAVRQVLGIAPEDALKAIWNAVATQDPALLVTLLNDLRAHGYQSGQLAKQIAAKFRQEILDGITTLDRHAMLQTLGTLLEVPASHDTDVALEIALLGLLLQQMPHNVTTFTPTPPAATKPIVQPPAPAAPVPQTEPPKTADAPKQAPPAPEPPTAAPAQPTTGVIDAATWQQVLTAMKQQYNTLHGVARMAHPQFDGNQITLSFAFPFHQKRLNEPKNKQIIMDIIKTVSGLDIMVTCVVDKNAAATTSTNDDVIARSDIPATTPAAASPNPALDAISNIFGGGEVIES